MSSQREKPWHKNASNLLVVNSILAAISVIVITATKGNVAWLVCAVAAMVLFIVSAEKITEAYDEDNVDTYVAYCLPYNLGVLLLFAALFGIIRHHADLSPIANLLAVVVLLAVWIWGWGYDTWFLICQNKTKFQAYIDGLEGRCEPERDPDWFTRLFLLVRSCFGDRKQRVLPHEGVCTRLQPSEIHGVGVFAIRQIKKGTNLFSDDSDEIVWIDEKEIATLPEELKKLYDDFAIIKKGRYGCPPSFNRLTMSWYLNDTDFPNVAVDDDYNMSALRDIEKGEELTIDSSQFSEQPYKKPPFGRGA